MLMGLKAMRNATVMQCRRALLTYKHSGHQVITVYHGNNVDRAWRVANHDRYYPRQHVPAESQKESIHMRNG